jgi:hypothetical protein
MGSSSSFFIALTLLRLAADSCGRISRKMIHATPTRIRMFVERIDISKLPITGTFSTTYSALLRASMAL